MVALVAVLGAGLAALGLPGSLLGSAPRQQEWRAEAAEIRIVDGETLRLGDRTVRLYGLEAPERGERCADAGGRAFDCGAAAADALSRLVAGNGLSCAVHGRDRFGRALGLCAAGPTDLNTALVSAGWALGDAQAVPALGTAEDAARRGGRGLWAAGFAQPGAWRGRQ
jgi:endonuclease YncB( thermonuclease family)